MQNAVYGCARIYVLRYTFAFEIERRLRMLRHFLKFQQAFECQEKSISTIDQLILDNPVQNKYTIYIIQYTKWVNPRPDEKSNRKS